MLQTRKAGDAVLALIIVLLATLSFGLGRLSATGGPKPPVTLCGLGEKIPVSGSPEVVGAGAVFSVTQGEYVASKNGTVYHFPWCSGAKRISEENKVWFTTKKEAERAGYRPASNCKGL